jgi:hypothetical protein
MIVFYSFIFAFIAVVMVSALVNRFGNGMGGVAMLITGLLSFVAAILFQLFAPKEWYFPVLCVAMAILMIALLVFIVSNLIK